MRARGVHLEYSFQPDDQHGADVHNPLFELLSAVREHGSIQHAARWAGAAVAASANKLAPVVPAHDTRKPRR